MASDAKDVGESGEMKRESCPAITEVCFQSRRRLAVCRRTMPKLTPLLVAGNPPAKSNCMLAELLAPASVGPKISRPISVCRKVAPKLAPGLPGAGGLGVVGQIQIIGAADVTEGIHQHNSREPGAVLGGGFHLGLVLLVNLRAQQLGGFFELLNAASQIRGR